MADQTIPDLPLWPFVAGTELLEVAVPQIGGGYLSRRVLVRQIGFMQKVGVFTPTILGSGVAGANTYADQFGYFFRMSSMVYVSLRVELSLKSGAMTGNAQIGGLPYGIDPSTERAAFANGGIGNVAHAASYTQFGFQMNPNSPAVIACVESGSNNVGANVPIGNLSNTSFFVLSGWYPTADAF